MAKAWHRFHDVTVIRSDRVNDQCCVVCSFRGFDSSPETKVMVRGQLDSMLDVAYRRRKHWANNGYHLNSIVRLKAWKDGYPA